MAKNKAQEKPKKGPKFKIKVKQNQNIKKKIKNSTTQSSGENSGVNDSSVLELMSKHPELNQTFEYILYSNKYKHTLTDVFNIIKMLMSKLEELQKNDVDIKNIFETINLNYKIKGLVQSTAINLSHVVEQLNVNESNFLNFAKSYTPMKITGDSEKATLDSMPSNNISMPLVSEEPIVSNLSTCSNNYTSPSIDIKTENITEKLNTNLFGRVSHTIVLSSDDEYDESSYNNAHKKRISAKIKAENSAQYLESYVIGSDLTDILSERDITDCEISSSLGQNRGNTMQQCSPHHLTPVPKVKKIKQKVSEEAINEARRSDFSLRKRLNDHKTKMLTIVKQLNLRPPGIVLEFDIVNKKPLVTIQKELANILKKHQVEGIRFVWNTVFETVNRTNTTDGTGCILAHRMGIGKTFQIITLMYTILCHSQINIKTFLIICPPGLIYNWMDEVYKWLGEIDKNEIVKVYDLPKTNKLYNISNIATWKSKGGILILSYENFKSLVNCKQSDLQEAFSHTLINPGPDVVILDEGHYIKNTNTILLKSLTQIRTKRRIVLTGTPIQNSLKEYFTMVDFVKPNILGNFGDFTNTFIKPIDSGQFIDSSDEAVKIMKQRTYILHKLLENTVHRIDDKNLKPLFTEKIEYTIEVNMTEFQCELYEKFLHYNNTSDDRCNVFLCLHVLTLITLHPLTLYRLVRYKNNKQTECGTVSFDEKCAKALSWVADYGDDSRFFEAAQGNKITFMLGSIDECHKRNEKVLCFLKSPLALDALEYFLQKEKNWNLGVDYFRMDGKTPLAIRNQMCEAFNNPENSAKLFILSLGTGCLGFNMVGANRVLLLSTSWNPSNDIQAIYRCLRFGQKKTVYVNRLLAKGTVEPKAYYRQISKLGMASSVVDLQHMSRKVSYDQTNDLFTFDSSWQLISVGSNNTKDPVLNQLIKKNYAAISDLKEHDSMLVESVEDQLTTEERKTTWISFKNKESGIKSLVNPKPLLKFNNTVQQPSATIVNEVIKQEQMSSHMVNESQNSTFREKNHRISPSPLIKLHYVGQQPTSTPINEDIKQDIMKVNSIPSNRNHFEEEKVSSHIQSENHNSRFREENHRVSPSPSFLGKHIKFTDNASVIEEPKNIKSEMKTSHYNKNRFQRKIDEPIQNQFRNFQNKSFSRHKKYASSMHYNNSRPYPFHGIKSRNSFDQQNHQHPNQYPNQHPNQQGYRTQYSNHHSSNDNNFHNRSGMSR